MSKHNCQFVVIDSKILEMRIVADYESATVWVDHNAELIGAGMVKFYEHDGPNVYEGTIGFELVPTYGENWQSLMCDGFMKLLIH